MEAFSDIFATLAGVPAIVGLALAAAIMFLTSDWRLSLTALLVQYVMVGLVLTRFIQAEIAVVKILTGVLAVFILYLSARRVQDMTGEQAAQASGPQLLGLRVGWGAGPLGLPLRLLTLLFVVLAVLLAFERVRLPTVPADVIFVALWLGGLGMAGLVVSGEPLRVAPAVLTIMAAFDLVYTELAPSLAVVGLLGALILLAALAFSYLAIVQGLSMSSVDLGEGEPEL